MKVQYNGVDLELVHTLSAERTTMLSDDGSDMLYTRHVYTFLCIYNPGATAYVPDGADDPSPIARAGTLPSITDESVRYALMEPRRQLLIVADEPGQNVILRSPAADVDVDCNNGPIPISCDVKEFTPRTWRVVFRIRTDIIECGGLDDNTIPIISNRWSQVSETGLDRRTTITTRGVTRFRTDQLERVEQNADHFRANVIPGLALKFQRQSISVMVNSAGDTLAWQVVDLEQFVFIGATNDARRMGVVTFEANFAAKTAPLDNVKVPSNFLVCRFTGSAMGDANSTRQGLINWLARLAIERCAIPVGPVDPATQGLILSLETTEDIHRPVATLAVTIQLPPAKNGLQGLGILRTDFIGVDQFNTFSNDGLSPQLPNDNNTRGTSIAEAFVNALKNACALPFDPPVALEGSSGYSTDNILETPSTSVNISVGENPPSNETRYSEEHTERGTYTEMQVESKYHTKRGKLACPITGKPQSPGYTPGGGSANDDSSGDDQDPDVEVLTVCRPMTFVEYRWEAERVSKPPQVPNPNVNTQGLTLLEDELSPLAVSTAPDGITPVYRIGGWAKYVATKARKAIDSVAFGVHPWTDFVYSDDGAQFDTSNFIHGIIDDADDSPGDGGGPAATGSPGSVR